MAEKTQKKSSRTLPLLLLLLVAVVAGGWYYYSQLSTPLQVSENTLPDITVSHENWDKALFQNAAYTRLRAPIPMPLPVEKKGNPSPFIAPVTNTGTPR